MRFSFNQINWQNFYCDIHIEVMEADRLISCPLSIHWSCQLGEFLRPCQPDLSVWKQLLKQCHQNEWWNQNASVYFLCDLPKVVSCDDIWTEQRFQKNGINIVRKLPYSFTSELFDRKRHQMLFIGANQFPWRSALELWLKWRLSLVKYCCFLLLHNYDSFSWSWQRHRFCYETIHYFEEWGDFHLWPGATFNKWNNPTSYLNWMKSIGRHSQASAVIGMDSLT